MSEWSNEEAPLISGTLLLDGRQVKPFNLHTDARPLMRERETHTEREKERGRVPSVMHDGYWIIFNLSCKSAQGIASWQRLLDLLLSTLDTYLLIQPDFVDLSLEQVIKISDNLQFIFLLPTLVPVDNLHHFGLSMTLCLLWYLAIL